MRLTAKPSPPAGGASRRRGWNDPSAPGFYLFAAVVVAAGVMVISARNPVHSVLFLILAFFNAAGCSC